MTAPAGTRVDYRCDANLGHVMRTVMLAEGTIPMFKACAMCGARAQSQGGPVDSLPTEFEWYKPRKPKGDREMRDYIEAGGLLFRRSPSGSV